jgi:23S rRNA (adenine2503-C2)-methyltransferase
VCFPGVISHQRDRLTDSRAQYVLLHGVNDDVASARELVRMTAGIPALLNVIPFNPWPGAPFEAPSPAAVRAFAAAAADAGMAVTVRWPRGRDISAPVCVLRASGCLSDCLCLP